MALTLEQVRHVARLARLHLEPEEEQRLAGEISAILAHVEQLQALDVTDVPPMTHASEEPTRFREDAVAPSLGAERAVANAPEKVDTGIAVPRIIE